MEVHHHSHTARKKWTHYFWEFLMLFLAVTLGFFVENQREHYIENKRAKEYAEMMKDDLLKDTVQLGGLIRGREMLLEAQKNWEKVGRTHIDKITWADLEIVKKPGIDITPFHWNDATYSQMKSSGNLRLFRDKELIKNIALYESIIKGFEFWNNSIRDFLKSDYMFRTQVNEEIFLNKNPNVDKTKSLKSLAYNFEAWTETSFLNREIINFQLAVREDYPQLNKVAAEIINLLNKKYHLE